MKSINALLLLVIPAFSQSYVQDAVDANGDPYTKVSGDLEVVDGNGGEGNIGVDGAVITKQIDSDGNKLTMTTKGGTEFNEQEVGWKREQIFSFGTSTSLDSSGDSYARFLIGNGTIFNDSYLPMLMGIQKNNGTGHGGAALKEYPALLLSGVIGPHNDIQNRNNPAIVFKAEINGSPDEINSPSSPLLHTDILEIRNRNEGKLVVDAAGNLGVGDEINPEEKLHVDGNAKVEGAVIIPQSGDISMGAFTNGTLQP